MKFTKETAREMGRKGGLKTKRKYGKKHYRKIATMKLKLKASDLFY